MKRFVEGADRGQSTLFPECLEDWIGEDNPVRVIHAATSQECRALPWPLPSAYLVGERARVKRTRPCGQRPGSLVPSC
jgi:hypothetical protein